MLTVHHLECSQSERIIWLCEELGIPYELKRYNRDPILAPAELKALTPMGGAPVIVDSTFNPSNPLTMSESAAIVEYIVHRHGGGRLVLPPSHENYSDYLYWFHQSNTTLQGSILRALLNGQLKLAPENPVHQSANARVKLVLDVLNDRLKQVTWLAGNDFTVADIMTVFSVTTMRVYYPLDLSGYDGILSWLQRVGERPAYKSAMQKGDPELVPCLGAATPDLFPAWAAIVK